MPINRTTGKMKERKETSIIAGRQRIRTFIIFKNGKLKELVVVVYALLLKAAKFVGDRVGHSFKVAPTRVR